MTPETFEPFVSEFENAEQEAAYTAWLQAKVAASLADDRPLTPHDQVIAELDAIIAEEASTDRQCHHRTITAPS